MTLFRLSLLLGFGIPFGLFAQDKPASLRQAPTKPEAASPPVAVAKPVPEPEDPAESEKPVQPSGPEDPKDPSPVTPPENSPETAPPAEPPVPVEPPPSAESLAAETTRIILVDGTRRIAVPLDTPGKPPEAGKPGLPRMSSPYPPKALAALPPGWKLEIDPAVSPLPYQVKLSDGRTLELEVVPPCLVPDATGKVTRFQLGRGEDSPESTMAAARKAHLESRTKVQELLKKLESTIPAPPPVFVPTP